METKILIEIYRDMHAKEELQDRRPDQLCMGLRPLAQAFTSQNTD